MSETVVVSGGTTDQDASGAETAVAFAAGAAAERSEQAEADAAEAQAEADSAAATAEVALDVASDASGTAWDARFEVEQLRERVDQLEAAQVADVIADVIEEETVEPPAAKDDTDTPAAEPEKKSEEPGYGRRGWFGNR